MIPMLLLLGAGCGVARGVQRMNEQYLAKQELRREWARS